MNNEEKEIEEALKIPFDYGSEEYLKLVAKIKAKREKYKSEKRIESVIKYKMYKEGLDK